MKVDISNTNGQIIELSEIRNASILMGFPLFVYSPKSKVIKFDLDFEMDDTDNDFFQQNPLWIMWISLFDL